MAIDIDTLRRGIITDATPAYVVVSLHGNEVVANFSPERGKWPLSGSNTDAATVINAAIAGMTAGRTWKEKIIIAGGTYNIKTKIQIPAYTELELHGTLKLGANTHMIETSSLVTRQSNIHIHGGYLQGNGWTGDGIRGILERGLIENIVIDNFVGNGVNMMRTDATNRTLETNIVNCLIKNCAVGVLVGSSDNAIIGNRIEQCTTAGIQDGYQTTRIIGNHLWNQVEGAYLIHILATFEIGGQLISGNFIDVSYGDAVVLDATGGNINNVVIVGNFFQTGMPTTNTYDVVRLARAAAFTCNHCVVSGNTCRATLATKPRYGIYETHAGGNIFTNNSITGCATASILVDVGSINANNLTA